MTEPVKPGKRIATYEDVLRAPRDKVAEVVFGELVVSPRPRLEHQRAAGRMLANLDPFDRKPGGPRGPGGWWILPEPELHLHDDIVVPDLAGWRRDRMVESPEGPYTTLSPDWICEVLSPSTAGHDRIAKMRIYLREHVGYVWLVDSAMRAIEVFLPERDRWVLAQTAVGSAPARLQPFVEVELELSRWWGETPDPPQEP
jgi:Uma2 family endonuclease